MSLTESTASSEILRPTSDELIKALTDWFLETGILNQRLDCNPLAGLFKRIRSPEFSYPSSIVSRLEEFFLTQDLPTLAPIEDGNLYIAVVGKESESEPPCLEIIHLWPEVDPQKDTQAYNQYSQTFLEYFPPEGILTFSPRAQYTSPSERPYAFSENVQCMTEAERTEYLGLFVISKGERSPDLIPGVFYEVPFIHVHIDPDSSEVLGPCVLCGSEVEEVMQDYAFVDDH